MVVRPLSGGGLQVTGASLKNLISIAYNVRTFQITGESPSVDTDRFDIDARSTIADAKDPTDPAKDRRKIFEGLKNLLADRFQLTLHSETREQSVYALVASRRGIKLHESTEPRSLIRKTARATIKGQAVSLDVLALSLSNELGRRVMDRTGLAGKYDFELQWDPAGNSPQVASSPELAPPADPNGPSLFSALQEQLGLRLESTKGPVEVLVVDRAERPSKN